MKHKWTLLLFGASFFVLLTGMKMPSSQPDSADLTVEITAMDDLRVQLAAQNETGKKLYLTVLMLEPNAFGSNTQTEIYTEEISGDVAEINRTLNLSELEIGTYQIKIKAGKKRFTHLVDIRAKPADVADDSPLVLFK